MSGRVVWGRSGETRTRMRFGRGVWSRRCSSRVVLSRWRKALSTVVVSARGLSDEQRAHCKSLTRKVEKTACVVSIIICIVSMPVIKMGIILVRIVFGIVTIINNGPGTVKTR